jgi:hypothetical protein
MGKKVYNEFRILCGKVPLFMTVSSIMTTEIARIQIRGLLLQATVALASGSFQTIAIENRDHGPMVGNNSVISQHVTKVRYAGSSCAEVLRN